MCDELISGEKTTMMLPTIRSSELSASAARRCTNDDGGCSIHHSVAPIAAAISSAITAPAIVT